MDTKIYVTKSQLDVVLAHVNGSECLDDAIAHGLTWTKNSLIIPPAALAQFLAFIGMRGDIASDNLGYAEPGELLPSERTEYRVTLNLRDKVECITGRRA